MVLRWYFLSVMRRTIPSFRIALAITEERECRELGSLEQRSLALFCSSQNTIQLEHFKVDRVGFEQLFSYHSCCLFRCVGTT